MYGATTLSVAVDSGSLSSAVPSFAASVTGTVISREPESVRHLAPPETLDRAIP